MSRPKGCKNKPRARMKPDNQDGWYKIEVLSDPDGDFRRGSRLVRSSFESEVHQGYYANGFCVMDHSNNQKKVVAGRKLVLA